MNYEKIGKPRNVKQPLLQTIWISQGVKRPKKLDSLKKKISKKIMNKWWTRYRQQFSEQQNILKRFNSEF